ncbi:hypothetical protein [Amorphus sp. 3PC139-8]|uniref:hypothetical protein n=1 Tax=Amorphus sp. 3PC139-8 TaxID=2735676 RepID=UPI00345D3664
MISILAAALATTFLLYNVILPAAWEQYDQIGYQADADAESMLRYHQRAVDLVDADPASFSPGSELVTVDVRYPYTNLGIWRAQVVVADGNLGIVTAPADFGSSTTRSEAEYQAILTTLSRRNVVGIGSALGTFPSSAPATVGGITLTSIGTPIAPGAPTLVTRLAASPTAP